MVKQFFQTDPDYVVLLLRALAGLIIFPYGLQKILGCFDDFGGGVGVSATMAQLKAKSIPRTISWMVIFAQSFGSLFLLIGLGGRLAAAGNFIVFSGALFQHLPYGWVMNWNNHKKGEGIEYFVMLLSILIIVVIKGSGAVSVDRWLMERL